MSRYTVSFNDARLPSEAGYMAPLDITPENGYVIQNFVQGFPEIRDVSDKRPAQHGTVDYTEFFGARAVSLMVSLAPELCTGSRVGMTDEDLEIELRSWMLPSLRQYLKFTRDDGSLRRMMVRAQNVSSQLNLVRHDFLGVALSWRAPDGVIEDDELTTTTLYPGGTGTELGRAYDLAFDRSYPASDPIGYQVVVNAGTAPVFPVVTFYGPMGQPRLENATTGKALEFDSGYSLLTGEYLVVDFKEGTVLLNGDAANSRYDELDFSVSEWFELIPGENNLRLYPLTQSTPASALVEFRSAYL